MSYLAVGAGVLVGVRRTLVIGRHLVAGELVLA
jgi:hypothetical protein